MCNVALGSNVKSFILANLNQVKQNQQPIEKEKIETEELNTSSEDSNLTNTSFALEPSSKTNINFVDNIAIKNHGDFKTISAIRTIPESQLESAWIGKIDSNRNPDGNKETAILTPKGFDPNKPIKIVYYFHGHNNGGNNIESSIAGLMNKEGKPPLSSIMDYAQKNNALVVIPQGPKTDSDDSKKGTWMSGSNTFELFNKDVISQIPSLQGKDISIELNGHSAGGIAIRNLIESISNKNEFDNTNGGKTTISKVNFLDASYNSGKSSTTSDRVDRTYSSISKLNKNSTKKINFEIVVTTNGDRTYNIDGKKVNSENPPDKDSGVILNYKQGKSEHSDVPRNFFSGKL